MKRKLGLALAGGGIKAYSQIGVLRVLEDKKMRIDMIAGTRWVRSSHHSQPLVQARMF